MNVIRKNATIENTDDEFPGSFRVILSAPTEDRDGETLSADGWKQPLPDHITFDIDHGMSVATTVGSGTPYLNDAGQVAEAPVGALIVDGTYSSLPLAQDTRTLVKEGHIKTTSVAYMTVPSKAKGALRTVRELLNGAFVAVPSNREAVVLESKSTIKAGARNAAADLEKIQQIHDLTLELGASPDGAKRAPRATTKSIAGSMELTRDRIVDELQEANPGMWVWLRGTVPNETGDGGFIVFDLEDTDTWESETYRQSYTNDGTTIALLDDRAVVEISEVVTQDPPEAPLPAESAGAPDLPPAAAGDKSATPADEAGIKTEIQVRAARYRAALNITSSTPEGNLE